MKKMRINRFFAEVLGAKVVNPRQSWGAIDSKNRIFLRVWEDHRKLLDDGEYVGVIKNTATPPGTWYGLKERRRHIAQIEEGVEAFGVLCVATDPDTKTSRNIKWFDQNTLLRLGKIREVENVVYIRIEGTIPVDAVVNSDGDSNPVTRDVVEIVQSNTDTTTKVALINARIGQGKFREEVLELWNNRCAVTGATTIEAIRASHIRPWSESSDAERLNPENGLPLVANLDALFDRGLISFEPDGAMIVSPKLSSEERVILGLGLPSLFKIPSSKMKEFLMHHRRKWAANFEQEGKDSLQSSSLQTPIK